MASGRRAGTPWGVLAEPGAQRPDPAKTPREGEGEAVATVGEQVGPAVTRREPWALAVRDAPRGAGRQVGPRGLSARRAKRSGY